MPHGKLTCTKVLTQVAAIFFLNDFFSPFRLPLNEDLLLYIVSVVEVVIENEMTKLVYRCLDLLERYDGREDIQKEIKSKY